MAFLTNWMLQNLTGLGGKPTIDPVGNYMQGALNNLGLRKQQMENQLAQQGMGALQGFQNQPNLQNLQSLAIYQPQAAQALSDIFKVQTSYQQDPYGRLVPVSSPSVAQTLLGQMPNYQQPQISNTVNPFAQQEQLQPSYQESPISVPNLSQLQYNDANAPILEENIQSITPGQFSQMQDGQNFQTIPIDETSFVPNISNLNNFAPAVQAEMKKQGAKEEAKIEMQRAAQAETRANQRATLENALASLNQLEASGQSTGVLPSLKAGALSLAQGAGADISSSGNLLLQTNNALDLIKSEFTLDTLSQDVKGAASDKDLQFAVSPNPNSTKNLPNNRLSIASKLYVDDMNQFANQKRDEWIQAYGSVSGTNENKQTFKTWFKSYLDSTNIGGEILANNYAKAGVPIPLPLNRNQAKRVLSRIPDRVGDSNTAFYLNGKMYNKNTVINPKTGEQEINLIPINE